MTREDHKKRLMERGASEVLLDLGISIPIWSWRLPFCKKPFWNFRLTMRRPTLGTLIRMARLYLSMGVTFDQMSKFTKEQEFEFIARHGDKVAEIVALSILRGGFKARLLTGCVKRIILNHLSESDLFAINKQFTPLLGTKAFTNIIRSVEIANPMKPKMSQN